MRNATLFPSFIFFNHSELVHIFASNSCCQLIQKFFFLALFSFEPHLGSSYFLPKCPTFFKVFFKNCKLWELQQVTTCGISDISQGGLKSLELKLLLFCRSKAKKIKRLCVISLVLFCFFYVTKGIGWIYHLPALSRT